MPQNCLKYFVIVNRTLRGFGNVGKIMTRMRQPAFEGQGSDGTSARQRIAHDRDEGYLAVFSRLPGAILRAAFVVLLIAAPSLLMPLSSADSAMIVTLIAICAASFTLVEYTAVSPSMVEFRRAPPFNRLRFGTLFLTVLTLSLVLHRVDESSTLTRFFQVAGQRVGASIDFPYSPVRLLVLMMPDGTNIKVLENLRVAGGLSYLISLLATATFVIMLRVNRWPRRNGAFNVWVNLPRFDPTAGGDVVARLNRDSRVNIILGFLLPFLIPAIIKITVMLGGSIDLNDPQTMVWMVTAWAFLPASLLMRGVALSRVAQLIHQHRKRAYAQAVADGMLPA